MLVHWEAYDSAKAEVKAGPYSAIFGEYIHR